MTTVYVDTSTLVRAILEEPDKAAIERSLATFEHSVASRLLRVELRRVGRREDALEEAERMLEGVSLVPVDEEILTTAETVLPANVGTLDAIHLATAIHLAETNSLDALMTYDKRLAAGAREHGLAVLSPS